LADPKAIEIGTIAPPEILRGVRVLVVDDNRTNQRILEGMLKRWEMKVTSVEGGEEALSQLCAAREAGEPYGLVLTDMHMPGMDGFALVERIRQRPELSAATIMMLTSAGHRGDPRGCGTLPGTGSFCVSSKADKAIRIARSGCQSTWGQGTEGAIPLITRFSLHDAREPAASLRVLLVEDNAVNQRLATRLLEKRGHSVMVAENGLEALEKESFDPVLMDVHMPVMDGFEATAAIRKKEGGSGIRVLKVALTAHAMKGDREKCLVGGMDGYLTKPIRPQELDELLEDYLVRRAETTETPESTLSKK
jgi:CheY-like chemotaxis protein